MITIRKTVYYTGCEKCGTLKTVLLKSEGCSDIH